MINETGKRSGSPVALLNTSICTDYGDYRYEKITIPQARRLVKHNGFVSFIGHEATAQLLTEILGVDVYVNRGTFRHDTGAAALVFRLKRRLDAFHELSLDEIKDVGYDLGLLRRLR